MPKRDDIKKVLVIGSGPIVIGQAAEFDYSGAQACQSFMEEGVEVVLVNSNPATIMTDKGMADKVYIEPINVKTIEKIIKIEGPDSIIAGMGGQTGLNITLELHDKGILDKYGVKVIGTSIESIKKGEDRELFRKLMEEIHQPVIESTTVSNLDEALQYAEQIGYPVVVRPAYTLGGSGGGIAENVNELKEIASKGLHLSRVGQVLIERSIKGWKEIEYEVIRDGKGNCIVVCNMENVDPVGIHTGDSIVVAPTQTLSNKECQMLRKASLDIISAIGIEGGCNVQFALHPKSFEYAVIEINPRVSRSSALASKATGYPIAKVASKIALGLSLDEIKNAVTKKTFACFEPSIDYVVVKIPKWPFDKFYGADRKLGTKMMATGEVMAIGNSFESALLKGIRSLELKQYSLDHKGVKKYSLQELREKVMYPNDERLFYLAEMLRRGCRVVKLSEETGMDEFFINKIKFIVDEEEQLKNTKPQDLTEEKLTNLKVRGFSDKGIADLMGISPNEVYEMRDMWGICTSYKMVDTCAGEFDAVSPYYYSTYDKEDEVEVSQNKKIIVIGSGPIRIGQGIEFDYCSVHCVQALSKLGVETIIINNNPETVSTDFNISDKLYFEPLTEEDTYNIIQKESPDGVILQFGGQTAIKLAEFFESKGIPVLGTLPKDIDAAEDREKFEEILEKLNIKRPKGKGIWTLEEGLAVAGELGYPILVRPSYVLGGQGMEICYDDSELEFYLGDAFSKDKKNPVLVDKYLNGMEIEVDAICDGEDVLIPGIMEHLERAGIHSGDSISLYPPQNVSQKTKDKIVEYTKELALSLNVMGMINIQFIEYNGELYIIEVNPRSSRTVPYISKVTGVPIIDIATRIMLGEKLKDLSYGVGIYPESKLICAKVPVFSTEKLPKVEASLGPEMRSTGEVLGVSDNLLGALYKGLTAAGMDMSHRKRRVLVTLREKDKEEFKPLALKMKEMNYEFFATENTANYLESIGIKVDVVKKIHEGSPNILDIIRTGNIDMVFNTPTKGNDSKRDGFAIRRTAIESSVELMTSLDKAKAIVEILYANINEEDLELYEIAEYGK
ncbi:carbamoyl-phosphate synthase large subunit [Alkalibaculum bacchi]|uniref:Carbamoyl phosphate synthase large chain n=1 Tax=Alkalibaculum bacchi TaxID=645887 RepID=A0A366IB45_9FIRM|nr:carbamoyl-phosphate synthase large subunit [Alkalibaculum bacchi]RBP67311.1 carbamoyl-phosphate synthase large subunit [Alkalibaculum bacchi]